MPPKYEHPKKFAHTPEDVPLGEHFAILCCRSIYISGHGYPASSEDIWTYEVYENREKWEQAIEYKTHAKDSFVPLRANRPTIEKKVFVGQTWPPYTPRP